MYKLNVQSLKLLYLLLWLYFSYYNLIMINKWNDKTLTQYYRFRLKCIAQKWIWFLLFLGFKFSEILQCRWYTMAKMVAIINLIVIMRWDFDNYNIRTLVKDLYWAHWIMFPLLMLSWGNLHYSAFIFPYKRDSWFITCINV